MKETTIDLIRTVLYSDETVTAEHQDSILRACRQTAVRRKLIGAKAAMEILQVSRPTLREYVKKGLLKPFDRRLFQQSFHDHIIRTENDYRKIWEYIDTNPLKWELDCFYNE